LKTATSSNAVSGQQKPSAPQTLAQLVIVVIKGTITSFVKRLPLMILVIISMSFVYSFLLLFVSQALGPAVSHFLAYILVLGTHTIAGMFLWALGGFIVTVGFKKAREKQLRSAISSAFRVPSVVTLSQRQCGQLGAPILILGCGVALFISAIFAGNPVIILGLVILTLGALISPQNSILPLALRLGWSDIQKFSHRAEPQSPLLPVRAAVMFSGISLGFLISIIAALILNIYNIWLLVLFSAILVGAAILIFIKGGRGIKKTLLCLSFIAVLALLTVNLASIGISKVAATNVLGVTPQTSPQEVEGILIDAGVLPDQLTQIGEAHASSGYQYAVVRVTMTNLNVKDYSPGVPLAGSLYESQMWDLNGGIVHQDDVATSQYNHIHQTQSPRPSQPGESQTKYEVYQIPTGNAAVGWTWFHDDGAGRLWMMTLGVASPQANEPATGVPQAVMQGVLAGTAFAGGVAAGLGGLVLGSPLAGGGDTPPPDGRPKRGDVTPEQMKELYQRMFDDVKYRKNVEGYWVTNPDTGFGPWGILLTGENIHTRWNELCNLAYERLGYHGGRCGEFAEWGKDWTENLVGYTFGDDHITLDLTARQSGNKDINHTANRAILPDGSRIVVDWWESIQTGNPKIYTERQWIEKWQKKLSRGLFSNDTVVIDRSEDETELEDLIRKYGEKKGIEVFRIRGTTKGAVGAGRPETSAANKDLIIKSYQKDPWFTPSKP
jgi:hypothetical protein